MVQKTRSELQELFKTGAKPSQQDFADFIESTLNRKDDGIEKKSEADSSLDITAPLKITAQGADEKLLDFYAGETNTWSIYQKSQDKEGKKGLNIYNSGGSRLFIDSSSGNVGIGTTSPGAKLEVNGNFAIKGVMSGTANDYQKAQFTLSGGGEVTWGGPGGRLKWTERFIAVSMEKGATFSNGSIDILQPTQDIPANNVFDGIARSANTNGVILKDWEALYAVHTIGGNENAVSYRIVNYTQNFEAPSNWLLVAVVNSDNKSIKLGTGLILDKDTLSTNSSPIPRGVIMMWYGTANNIPGGWVLCNGQNSTPDLRDRFILGAGNSENPGTSGGPDQHTHYVGQINTNYGGSHSHGFPSGWYNRNFKDGDKSGIDIKGANIDNQTTESAGSHYHSINSFNTGSSSGKNRPKWYALCFIMKL